MYCEWLNGTIYPAETCSYVFLYQLQIYFTYQSRSDQIHSTFASTTVNPVQDSPAGTNFFHFSLSLSSVPFCLDMTVVQFGFCIEHSLTGQTDRSIGSIRKDAS